MRLLIMENHLDIAAGPIVSVVEDGDLGGIDTLLHSRAF